MSNWILISLLVVGGFAVAVQPSFNARLAEKIGFLHAATVSFAIGTLVLYLLAVTVGKGSFRYMGEAQWWQFMGGLFGAFFVTMMIVGVPRIGTTAVLTLSIVSQLVAGVLMDHYGLFGMNNIPFDFKRAIGIAFLLAGVFLIYKH
jgi:transporter family-2 protein